MVTKGHKTTYAPVNLTALCIIFSGCALDNLGVKKVLAPSKSPLKWLKK